MPSASEVRQQFIDFFVQKHGHAFTPSSPVVPHDDPTLLFTNAGMNQFKPIFLGQVEPGSPLEGLTRAVNSQKCIRAGGKHNDLEDVGRDTYHHTFFEMLGNWSFGDYFKKEAIDYAWELLTKVWKIDPERLYATYFEGNKALGLEPDREAYDLWSRYLPPRRIIPGNMKDNFWEMGDTGPCGPCSELHYDGRSDAERAQVPGDSLVNRDDPRVIEIWNLVFIQFNRVSASELRPLPAKHVDTGMGLERIARVLEGKQSNYDTDLFAPLFERLRELTGADAYAGALESSRDIAYRVCADHARALTFAITDGAVPSNEGRGYVLRRMLRRAVVQGQQHLGARGPFLHELVATIVEHYGDAFPELKKNPQRVAAIVKDEEQAFGETLRAGLTQFELAVHGGVAKVVSDYLAADLILRDDENSRYIVEARRDGVPLTEFPVWLRDGHVYLQKIDEDLGRVQISGYSAFQLHDTFGFPIDLTQVMARERGMTVDVEGYERLMEEARERSRAGGKSKESAGIALSGEETARLKHLRVRTTDDSDKYHGRPIRATVRAIWNGTDFDEEIVAADTHVDDRFGLILDKTNFYAESGGQVGDVGEIRKGSARFDVLDTQSFGGYVLHIGRMHSGSVRVGDSVELDVDRETRGPTMANHTATHLLNLALREAIDEPVDQKGSLVAPDRLRFDFTASRALTDEQVERVERRVRDLIAANLPVYAGLAPLAEARQISGLRAVFGEKYPDPVRVVSVGAPVDEMLREPASERWSKLSIEFCGGSHLASTGDAGSFAITSEEAVAKGVRRIQAVTGRAAVEAIAAGDELLDRVGRALSAPAEEAPASLGEITREMESKTLPYVVRRRAQRELAALQEKAKEAQKAGAAAGREAMVQLARDLAMRAEGVVIVADLPGGGGDRQGLLAALDVMKSRHPNSAVMLLATDEESRKVAIVANVPATLVQKGLKAGDWVRKTAAACGGKGGGKPDSAQGGGTDIGKLVDAMEAARVFAMTKVG